MKPLRIAVISALLTLPCVGCVSKTRVGTYDSRAVALAYGRSKLHDAHMDDLDERLEKAQAAGDADGVARLKAIEERLRKRLHGQVFGEAPIPGIIALITHKLPAIKRRAGVRKIAAEQRSRRWLFTKSVDVTDALVDLFDPSEQTRVYIRQLRESNR